MSLAITRARLLNPHRGGLFIVLALFSDPVKPGGMIERLTFEADVTHTSGDPLKNGDVCHISNGDFVRCGSLSGR